MNALIRKFRVASTAGVVMSLAMASMLAMAPMSDAMAKRKNGTTKTVTGTGVVPYVAWFDGQGKMDNICGVGKYKVDGNPVVTATTVTFKFHCI